MSMARKVLSEESSKKWIKCQDGWISYTPTPAGDRYVITATGHRQHVVTAAELHGYLDELARNLGGRARG